jgi:hypothetical protein
MREPARIGEAVTERDRDQNAQPCAPEGVSTCCASPTSGRSLPVAEKTHHAFTVEFIVAAQ